MDYQFIGHGPDLDIAFLGVPKKGGKHFEAKVKFHPARIRDCPDEEICFKVIHPDTKECLGELIFSTGSNRVVDVEMTLLGHTLCGTLQRIRQSVEHSGTVSLGCDPVAPKEFFGGIKGLWVRACLDDVDNDEASPKRWYHRRQPSCVRLIVSFPVKAALKKAA